MSCILVEAIAAAGAVKAECLAGARAGPPDDCGGAGGYERLVESLAHPNRKESRDLLEWVGADFVLRVARPVKSGYILARLTFSIVLAPEAVVDLRSLKANVR